MAHVTTESARTVLEHYDERQDNLIPILQEIQEEFLGNKFLKPSARKEINSPFMEKLHRANVKMIPMFTGVGEDWKKYENQYREVFKK